MMLFWLLCVSLVLVGLALRRPLGAAAAHVRLTLYGVRVPCRRTPRRRGASSGRAARSGPNLPPGFANRAGP